MGNTAPKPPNTSCSELGCNAPCISSTGHRIRKPHKARCCAVCSKWYCGDHKKSKLLRCDDVIYTGDGFLPDCCYKCPECCIFTRKHQS
mmetsp:Transcript_22877/g.20108  ORF Transcript_22877/g.20108 Transcript_22877/m.20108 type:complete len:89 (-) Transcript_22877:49-315(-)